MMKLIQKSSGEGHLNNVPGYDVPTDPDAVKDVMSDVMADPNDITQLRAYDAAKDAWTKDYDALLKSLSIEFVVLTNFEKISIFL